MRTEINERDERSTNIVVYGIKESKEEAPQKRKEDDEKGS